MENKNLKADDRCGQQAKLYCG